MASASATISIGDLARRSGVPASTLRYYESVGLLPPPRRVSGRRRYHADVLRRLTWIRVAQQAGFSLAEIQTLLDGFSHEVSPADRWQVLAPERLCRIDEEVERLLAMRARLQRGPDCSCATMEQCLAASG